MTPTPQGIFPFFTGCQRSGTTLLRAIFSAHPDLLVPRESYFIPWLVARRRRYERTGRFDVETLVCDLTRNRHFRRWPIGQAALRGALVEPPVLNLADAIRRVYAAAAAKRGKTRYGDKTPNYTLHIPLLAALFPEARFVHVVRDGRAVAASLLGMDWGPRRIEHAALFWRERVEAARDAGRALGPHRYFEYRHEELAADPEPIVRRICEFIDLPFDERMLRYHERPRPRAKPQGRHLSRPPTPELRDWRIDLDPTQRRSVELLTGNLLEVLGYTIATDRQTLSPVAERAAKRRARAARALHRVGTSHGVSVLRTAIDRTPLAARGSFRWGTGGSRGRR